MNWLQNLTVESKRRFNLNDRVRFFVQPRKGMGKGIVHTPSYQYGSVINFDPMTRQYIIRSDDGENFTVHPRNIVPETL